MIARLFKFHGGVKPDAHKHESAGEPIQRAPLPSRLVVPLRQSTRASARCILEVGQKVLKGQRIGDPEGMLGTAVHAPTFPMARPTRIGSRSIASSSGCCASASTGAACWWRSAAG